jgi:lipopolysaccharide transport system permease protein
MVTYLPDNAVRRGYASLLGDIGVELIDSKFLTAQLFKRDLMAFYKQSLLGVFWIVLVPLITVGTFVMLRGSGIVSAGEIHVPYPIFATLGLAFWQIFAQGIIAGANSLVQSGDMITRINFSKKSLVIASLGRTIVSFLTLVLLSAVLMGYYAWTGHDVQVASTAWLAPFALLPIFLFTLGASFYLALANGIVRDIGTMLGVVVTFVMLLTPVLYERPLVTGDASASAKLLDTLTTWNPLYYLVSAPRDLVLDGSIAEPQGFWLAAVASVAFFCVSLIGFHLAETRIAERI